MGLASGGGPEVRGPEAEPNSARAHPGARARRSAEPSSSPTPHWAPRALRGVEIGSPGTDRSRPRACVGKGTGSAWQSPPLRAEPARRDRWPPRQRPARVPTRRTEADAGSVGTSARAGPPAMSARYCGSGTRGRAARRVARRGDRSMGTCPPWFAPQTRPQVHARHPARSRLGPWEPSCLHAPLSGRPAKRCGALGPGTAFSGRQRRILVGGDTSSAVPRGPGKPTSSAG